MDTEKNKAGENSRQRLHFEWLLPIFVRPKKTLDDIAGQEKQAWLTPLLVISLLVIIAGLIAWPIRRDALVSSTTLPVDFQNYSSDQQKQYLEAQSTQSSAVFTLIFPLLGSLAGVWVGWFLMSSILHMSNFVSGSSTERVGYYNLVGWAMMPIALRSIVRILAMLFTHTVVSSAGLSGFVTNGASGGGAFLAGILGQIDLFSLWECFLLFLGGVSVSGLSRSKNALATSITLLIMVLLSAVPHLLSSLVSSLSM